MATQSEKAAVINRFCITDIVSPDHRQSDAEIEIRLGRNDVRFQSKSGSQPKQAI